MAIVVAQDPTQGQVVKASTEGRVDAQRRLKGQRREAGASRSEADGRIRSSGGSIGGGQTKQRMSHGTSSLAATVDW